MSLIAFPCMSSMRSLVNDMNVLSMLVASIRSAFIAFKSSATSVTVTSVKFR